MRVQLRHFGFFIGPDFSRSCGIKLMLGLFERKVKREFDDMYRLNIELHFSLTLGFRYWITTHPAWMEEPTAVRACAWSMVLHAPRYQRKYGWRYVVVDPMTGEVEYRNG